MTIPSSPRRASKRLFRIEPVLALAVLTVAASAQTPSPKPPSPPAARPKPAPAAPTPQAQPAPDPAYEAAKVAFESLPEAVRKAVQDALVWTGDYNAVTAGTFGRRTFEGIEAWQKRARADSTGILTPAQRAALDAAGEAAREAARFKVQGDSGSGAVIGVPEKLLSRKSPLVAGTRWQSADGRVTLDTKAFKPGEGDLDVLFERASAQNAERRITYKLKKPDFLVVTGETASGRFYIRYAAGTAGIRGFTIAYDKALPETDKLVIAVANSFVPFPEDAPKPGMAATPGAGPTAATLAPSLPARPAATGLAVAPGRVVTSASAIEGCASLSVAGRPARPARRDGAGMLALLETEPQAGGKPSQMPVPRGEAPRADEPLVVLGAEAKGVASVAPGVAGTGSVLAPLQPGAGGAPVLDRSGQLVGLVARFPAAPRLIAGVMPPTSYALVPGSAVAAFLAESGVTETAAQAAPKTAPAGTLGAAAAPYLGAVVAVACGR